MCCKQIAKFPQTEFKERKAIGDQLTVADANVVQPANRLLLRADDKVTIDECRQIGELYHLHVQRTIEALAALDNIHAQSKRTTVKQLISSLEDVIDRVLDHRQEEPQQSASSAAAAQPVHIPPRPQPPTHWAGEHTVFMMTQHARSSQKLVQGVADGLKGIDRDLAIRRAKVPRSPG